MDLATWNVNSVRAREDRLAQWLERRQPDVLCLQETKVVDEGFPRECCEALGYHVSHLGEQGYNGVAILSRTKPEEVWTGLGDEVPHDTQSRLIGARIGGVTILSAYFPNGDRVDSDKYPFKLRWMQRLAARLKSHHAPDEPLALCGDFNVAPFFDDVASPDTYEGGVLANDEVRGALADIADFGLVDVFRPFHPAGGVWTYWDYRGASFERDDGLRIDHVFCTAPLAERVVGAWVDREERHGKGASDHAPLQVRLSRRELRGSLWPPVAPGSRSA